MKTAIIGSRSLTIQNLSEYLPPETTEIVSGGAKGIDTCARECAMQNNLELTEFLPEYDKYGRRASIVRNVKIIEYSDIVLAFWDGKSRGTKHVIDYCTKHKIPLKIFLNDSV